MQHLQDHLIFIFILLSMIYTMYFLYKLLNQKISLSDIIALLWMLSTNYYIHMFVISNI